MKAQMDPKQTDAWQQHVSGALAETFGFIKAAKASFEAQEKLHRMVVAELESHDWRINQLENRINELEKQSR